ncbi:MAG: hypothetical protein KME42_11485 [Tildeniella nuda ZEHNDER 1965/U140]|jgi:hypothetical protein|nr:hypothetical protein [Tildeniella nuda ZEHNDER 1965/U140]
MYVIQVNEQDWLVGIWRGWLTLSLTPSAALVYRSLTAAEKATSYYSEVAPGRDYTVQPICSAIAAVL